MHETVCLLSLGTEAYLGGGLARIGEWLRKYGRPVSFIALDSLEEINEKALGAHARPIQTFLSLLEHTFSPDEYDFYLSSQLEADPRYSRYLEVMLQLFSTNRSLNNLAASQTFRSLHRRLITIGVKNQRHTIVRELLMYVVRELSLLAYLSGEFGVGAEISFHAEMPIRTRTALLLPSGMGYPRFIALDRGSAVNDLTVEALVVPVADGRRSVGPLNFTVRAGSILGILGPNGVGKSTLLRAIGGHLSPTSGRIFLGTRDVTHSTPIERNVASVFQDSALFPSKSLGENIVVGERLGFRRQHERLRYDGGHILGVFELNGRQNTKSAKLSGGEQQLGSIARALSSRPSILLLDEPGASIDQIRKRKALGLIREYVQATGAACILVTHDAELLFSICDDLLVFSREGQVIAHDHAAQFVTGGASMTAAELIGLPNLFRCNFEKSDTVLVPDLGLSVQWRSVSAQCSKPLGLHIPPRALYMLSSKPNDSAVTPITISGRVQFHATTRDGDIVLLRVGAVDPKKTGVLGQSVLLTVAGSPVQISSTNEIVLGLSEDDICWMAE